MALQLVTSHAARVSALLSLSGGLISLVTREKVVEIFPEFNLAFEALLLIGSPCEGVDRTYDSVQCGIG